MERSSEELYQMKDLKYAAESGNKKVILGKKKKKKGLVIGRLLSFRAV